METLTAKGLDFVRWAGRLAGRELAGFPSGFATPRPRQRVEMDLARTEMTPEWADSDPVSALFGPFWTPFGQEFRPNRRFLSPLRTVSEPPGASRGRSVLE